MPGFDRKGPPNGEGNQSGRRMGKCHPDSKKDSENQSIQDDGNRPGRGRRKGLGLGPGNRKKRNDS